MSDPQAARLLIESAARHLPPSASVLRLLDVGGAMGDVLAALRHDLQVTRVEALHSAPMPDHFDAVVGLDQALSPAFLAAALESLRAGGRLIVVAAGGVVSEAPVTALESAGYTRILVEPAPFGAAQPLGVLMRGEKPHTTADTLARIQGVAQHDGSAQALENYRGRFVHLLIVQTPNKPVWALREGENYQWRAAAIDGVLLGFSSLPRAVGFMQPAILQGLIRDVNKVVKFSRAAAEAWPLPVILNPPLETLAGGVLSLIDIDPASAEASDE